MCSYFFFSSRRRHTRCALVTGVQTCALPILGEGTAFRVESEDMEDIRHDLAEAFRGLLTPQDQAPWRPHVTIQNKVEPREAKRLQQQIRATFQQIGRASSRERASQYV